MKRKINLGRSSNIIKRQRLLRLSQKNNGNDNSQITSFGATEIRHVNVMQTFKVQGQVYHLAGSLFIYLFIPS